MKWSLLALLVLIAAAVPALANPPGGPGGPDPRNPCAPGRNPTTLCDNSNITVVDEPAGANCEFGGIKVVVEKKKPPPPKIEFNEEPVTTVVTKPEPPKPPETETFFVCNGAPGQPGPAGPPGANGQPGAPGATGPAGPVTFVPTPAVPKRCGPSVRLRQRFYLPARFDAKRVTLTIQGPNTTRVRFNGSVPVLTAKFGQQPGRYIIIPLRNRNCGRYLLRLHQAGAGPDLAGVWTITGLFGLTRQRIA